MTLAEMRHIPRVWAALIRVLTVARSLVAFERGAIGPGKDCAYEGTYIKAITGYPIAMEGSESGMCPCIADWEHRQGNHRLMEQRICSKHQAVGRHGANRIG